MWPILFRVLVLTVGIAFGEMGLDSLVRGVGVAPAQLALAIVLLGLGAGGFVAPLLSGRTGKEVSRDV
jgi:hypothetical protein